MHGDRSRGCTRRCSRALLSALALALLGAGAPEEEAQVKQCVRANFPQDATRQRLELETSDRAGRSRTLSAVLHWKRFSEHQARVLIRVQAPADLRGAAYLIAENEPEDDLYMYLPSAQKVRRITSRTASSRLWGTDFSFEDFKRIQSMATAGESRLTGQIEIDSRPAWVLQLEPGTEDPSGYSRIESFIDRETCLPLETHFFGPKGQRRKVLAAKRRDFEQIDGRWVARRLDMRDERDGTHTELRVLAAENGIELPDHIFSPSRLAR